MKRSLLVLASALTATAAVAAILVGGGGSSTARAATSGLTARVVLSAPGPFKPCPSGGFTSACSVFLFVHVANANPLLNVGAGNRTLVKNAFVLDSVQQTDTRDGKADPNGTINFALPPNVPNGLGNWSGRWPATVTCATQAPCNSVTNPAILPGEDTVGLYTGEGFDSTDAGHKYVFKYTLHGTLNGKAVTLTASSATITVTH